MKEKSDCNSCGDDDAESCPKSKRACGHHCNHSWTHDGCCWCDKEWDEDDTDARLGRVKP